MEQKQEKLYALLNEKLDHTEEISDEEILVEIDKLIWEEAKGQYMPLSEKITLRQQLFNGIRRLDILQELLEDESVTEIMVNGTDGILWREKAEYVAGSTVLFRKTKLEDVVQQIAGKCNRIVNEAIPITDARLENGDRVNIVPAAGGCQWTDHYDTAFSERADHDGASDRVWECFKRGSGLLKQLVLPDTTFLSAAEPVPGKQRSLNALSDYIPKDERIITIEDNAELQIQGVENLVRPRSKKRKYQKENMQLRSGSDQEQSANETKQDHCRRGAGR